MYISSFSKGLKQPCVYKYAGILQREDFDGSCSQELTSVYTHAIMYVLRAHSIKEERSACSLYVYTSRLYTHRRKYTPLDPRGHVNFARDILSLLPSLRRELLARFWFHGIRKSGQPLHTLNCNIFVKFLVSKECKLHDRRHRKTKLQFYIFTIIYNK